MQRGRTANLHLNAQKQINIAGSTPKLVFVEIRFGKGQRRPYYR